MRDDSNRDDGKRLFRKTALDRLTTSDRLDQTLVVSSAKGWLALAMLVGIVLVVLAWSMLGEVSTFVSARGILLGRDGVIVDAASSGNGALTRIIPGVGDRVEAGAVVAVLVNPEVAELHRSAVALVEENARALDALRAAGAVENDVRAEQVARQRDRSAAMEADARASFAAARDVQETHRRLFAEGLIAELELEQSQRSLDAAQRDLFAILREREELDYAELRRRNEHDATLTDKEASLHAAERIVSELRAQLAAHEVLAPVSGRVTEIKAALGAVLSAGAPVLSIRPASEALEALIYIPPAHGKRIRPEMEVLVSPSSARREEFGWIRGRIAEVAAFPASRQGMIATLQSPDLAEAFSSEGTPYAARVELVADPRTASGLAWSSSRGAGRTVTSGTLVDVEIRVERKPPITLVAPALARILVEY